MCFLMCADEVQCGYKLLFIQSWQADSITTCSSIHLGAFNLELQVFNPLIVSSSPSFKGEQDKNDLLFLIFFPLMARRQYS